MPVARNLNVNTDDIRNMTDEELRDELARLRDTPAVQIYIPSNGRDTQPE